MIDDSKVNELRNSLNSFSVELRSLRLEFKRDMDEFLCKLARAFGLSETENHYPFSQLDSLELRVEIVESIPSNSSQRQLVINQLEVSGGATQLVKSKNSLRLDSIVVVFQVALSISVECVFHYIRCSGLPSTKISSSGVLGTIWYPP
jgi:hypothetical protein